MSDFQRYLKKKASSPEVKRAEGGERAEGVEKALKAGRGDVVAGAKRLGMDVVRPKMKATLKRAQKPCKGGKAAR